MVTAKPPNGGGSEPVDVESLRVQLQEIEDKNRSLVAQLSEKNADYNRIFGELSHVKHEIARLQNQGFKGKKPRNGRRNKAARSDGFGDDDGF
eukprot:562188-Rhodomonas_salina.1